MASQNLLERLRRLDRPSSGFPDQLSNILYGEDYTRCVPDLQGDDLAWLIDYLDNVRRRVPLLPPSSSYRSHSILSTLHLPLTGSVCANSETYVALGRYCRPRTPFRLRLSTSIVNLSPREAPGISSRGPSTVQASVSNALEYTLTTVPRKSQKYVIYASLPLSCRC